MRPGQKYYDDAMTVAKMLADDGFAIITAAVRALWKVPIEGPRRAKRIP